MAGVCFVKLRLAILTSLHPMRNSVSRLLYQMHLLNLDVAGGAVASNLMVRYLLRTPAYSVWSYFVLGSTVWIIYTADRLWDVRRMTELPLTARHRFHFHNRKALWKATGIVTGLTAVLTLLFLPFRVIGFGLGLAVAVALYLWLVHLLSAHYRKKWFQKEPLVAVLYTAGIWGPVWVLRGYTSAADCVLCLLFAAIAFQNLLLFSLFDLENDQRRNEQSLATYWGAERIKTVFQVLSAGILLACLVAGLALADEVRQQRVAGILAGMGLVLLCLGHYPDYFRRNESFRWLGDGIFFLPLLVLL
jgi:4-hydroxybenzoate polyprenyltransferase